MGISNKLKKYISKVRLKILYHILYYRINWDDMEKTLDELKLNDDEMKKLIEMASDSFFICNIIKKMKLERNKLELLDKYNHLLSTADKLDVVLTLSFSEKEKILSSVLVDNRNEYGFTGNNVLNIMYSLQYPDEFKDFIKSDILNSRIDILYELLKEIKNKNVENIDNLVYETITNKRENILSYDNNNREQNLAYFILLIENQELLIEAMCDNREYIGSIFEEMVSNSFNCINYIQRNKNFEKFKKTFAKLNDEKIINYTVFLDDDFRASEALHLQGLLTYSNRLDENTKSKIIKKLYELKKNLQPDEAKKLIDLYLNNSIDCETFCNINSAEDYFLWEKYCEPNGIFYSGTFSNTISIDIIKSINDKHINDIILWLKEKYNDEIGIDLLEIAFTMYLTLGYNRTRDIILMQEYGNVPYSYLGALFTGYDLRFIQFEEEGKSKKPIINDKFVVTLLGQNYKSPDSLLKKLLGGKIQKNSKEMFYLEHISAIFNNYDIINEEFLRVQCGSKLKVKLNVSTIVDIIDNLTTIQNRMKDERLLQVDFFKFVGRDTQYTQGKSTDDIIERAVFISNSMSKVKGKKFPIVSIPDNDYTIEVLKPSDRKILCLGYETGCCFRPCGNADDFGGEKSLLKYCATEEYGGVVVMRDNRTNKVLFMSPILRNGNIIMLNSIESLNSDIRNLGYLSDILYKKLKALGDEMIRISHENGDIPPIEAVLLGNLHYTNPKYSSRKIEKVLPPFLSNNAYDGMYTNLDRGFTIISSIDNFNLQDIKLGEVNSTYFVDDRIIHEIEVSQDNVDEVEQCLGLKKEIINLSNSLISVPYDKRGEIITKINEKKKIYIKMFKKNINEIEQQEKILGIINNINKSSNNNTNSDLSYVVYIKYSDNWYIALDKNGRLHVNCTEDARKECDEELKKFKEKFNVNKKLEGEIIAK